MRVCPKCGEGWFREERSTTLVCREVRLLDINYGNGDVDVDETEEWRLDNVSSFFCVSCGTYFHVGNLAKLWEELKDED